MFPGFGYAETSNNAARLAQLATSFEVSEYKVLIKLLLISL